MTGDTSPSVALERRSREDTTLSLCVRRAYRRRWHQQEGPLLGTFAGNQEAARGGQTNVSQLTQVGAAGAPERVWTEIGESSTLSASTFSSGL